MWHASRLAPPAPARAERRACHSMRRYLLIITAVAVLVWAVLAIVLDSPSLKIGSSSEAVAASPPCELSSPGRSAALSGTHVFASPAPGGGRCVRPGTAGRWQRCRAPTGGRAERTAGIRSRCAMPVPRTVAGRTSPTCRCPRCVPHRGSGVPALPSRQSAGSGRHPHPWRRYRNRMSGSQHPPLRGRSLHSGSALARSRADRKAYPRAHDAPAT